MNSLLVKIASVAVMVHMALGCSLHHGLGTSACASHHANGCEQSHLEELPILGETDCCHDHFQYSHTALTFSLSAGQSHGPVHFGCSDDSCNAIQFVKFEFESLDLGVEYLGGVESLALTKGQDRAGCDTNPFPDYSHTGVSVRAHLRLGVQIV